MQDREQIEKEIETVRMQLSYADISALTAPLDDKDNWEKRKNDLQSKLEDLQKQLEECVVFNGESAEPENAMPIIDEDTADAMLAQILATGEPIAENVSPDLSAESADEVTVNPSENKIEMPMEMPADETDEAAVQAMIDEILMAGDEHHHEVNFSEAQAPENASVSQEPIPNESEPQQESESVAQALEQEAVQEAIVAQVPEQESAQDVIVAQAPEQESVQEGIVAQAPEQESVQVPDSDSERAEPLTVPISPWQPEDDSAEEMLKEILAATSERESVREPQEYKKSESVNKQSEPSVAEEVNKTVVLETGVMQTQTPSRLFASDFDERLAAAKASGVIDSQLIIDIEKLRLEAQAAFETAERLKKEAEQIKLSAETERAMYGAEMELQRGLRTREDALRTEAERAEKDRIAEKIARRKAEITEIRNGLQEVKDSESAFALREKLFAVQLVLDEDERNSQEISFLLTKTLDDLSHLLEVADLKRRIAAMVTASKKAAAKSAAAKKKAQVQRAQAKKAAAKKAAAKKAAAAKKKKAALARKRMMMMAMHGRRLPPAR